MCCRGGSRFLVRWGPTIKALEMSQRIRRGGAKGVAGGQCERGLNPLLLGGLPPENFQNLGWFLLQSRHFSALFQGQDFPRNSKKNLTSQINEQIRAYTWPCMYTIQYTQSISDGRAPDGTMHVCSHKTLSSLAGVFLGWGNPHVCWQEHPIFLLLFKCIRTFRS